MQSQQKLVLSNGSKSQPKSFWQMHLTLIGFIEDEQTLTWSSVNLELYLWLEQSKRSYDDIKYNFDFLLNIQGVLKLLLQF